MNIGPRLAVFALAIFSISCSHADRAVKVQLDWFKSNPQLISDGFDHPVGPPDGNGYYNAQGFGENNHLGDDWNGVGGGDSDLGDPIYAIANGQVTGAKDHEGGWGKIIRIVHAIPQGDSLVYVESIYAHCDSMMVTAAQGVSKGDLIGTIGTAHGKYLAHLHFEIRDRIGMKIGPGYSADQTGYLDPTVFLEGH